MEHIKTPKVEGVQLLHSSPGRPVPLGTMYLTATHIIFTSDTSRSDPNCPQETWLAHTHIASVQRQPRYAGGFPLVIYCKTFRVLHLLIPHESDCQDVMLSLTKLMQPGQYEDLYAFSYKAKASSAERQAGWNFINLRVEFGRIGLPNKHWQLTNINQNYQVCETYPAKLYVPVGVSDITLLGSSRFRSRGRFPVLSYLHVNNGAAICRSSQPLAGFSARCLEDEGLLEAIRQANPGTGQNALCVVDTRPKLNAIANRAAGKGYENEENYANIRFRFLGIENIHVMRNSLTKLLEVCQGKALTVREFISGLAVSGWLRHIQAIMQAATYIAKAVSDEGISVLVHCSDGWDRTTQACALASLMLDPHYRTMLGFMVLVEKEWLSFGHKFSHRCGFLEGDPREVSPVFTQFLECIWQLQLQFPCSFQYNEHFLLYLHELVYSCQFGNFLGNHVQERETLRLLEKTHTVWTHLWERRVEFRNPLYNNKQNCNPTVLLPSTTAQCFRFWKGMYWPRSKRTTEDVLLELSEKNQELEKEISLLDKVSCLPVI
uniref:Myotubularin related protein 8 n=1 Tax=Eptatretus burgeri TaxID=7764 RepID=A0A8C4WZG5_EPTBU